MIQPKPEREVISDFAERWNAKTETLKETSLNNNQIKSIHRVLTDELVQVFLTNYTPENKISDVNLMTQLANDLFFSLMMARSNYRREKQTFKILLFSRFTEIFKRWFTREK